MSSGDRRLVAFSAYLDAQAQASWPVAVSGVWLLLHLGVPAVLTVLLVLALVLGGNAVALVRWVDENRTPPD